MRRLAVTRGWLLLAAITLAGASAITKAQTYSVLYSFQCAPSDGAYPQAGLVRDAAGNLYGTTAGGGTSGFGTVFELSPTGNETLLHSFSGSPSDGETPLGTLVRDTTDNLYGVTSSGGAYGYGTVFKLSSAGSETILYSFTGGGDGNTPLGGLVRDSVGNLYGTTLYGGGWGAGVIFKLSPRGHLTTLHDFAYVPTDGAQPTEGLSRDSVGNLYGTTSQGGAFNLGTIFQLTPTGGLDLLHSFAGPPTDGFSPGGGRPLLDSSENLVGAAAGGAYNMGAVYNELTASGDEKILFNSLGGSQGIDFSDDLVQDAIGNIYGTTGERGSLTCNCGILFKLTTSGREFVLHKFVGGPTDGQYPAGVLLRDSAGSFYGVTMVAAHSGVRTAAELCSR